MLVKVKCLKNRNTEELDYIEGQEYYAFYDANDSMQPFGLLCNNDDNISAMSADEVERYVEQEGLTIQRVKDLRRDVFKIFRLSEIFIHWAIRREVKFEVVEVI